MPSRQAPFGILISETKFPASRSQTEFGNEARKEHVREDVAMAPSRSMKEL